MLLDLREVLENPQLKLPIGGKVFVVKACSALTWLKLNEIHARSADMVARGGKPADAASASTGMTDIDMYKLSLGDAFDEIAKVATGNELKHAALTAYFWQLSEEQVAEAMWMSGGKAAAPKPRRRTSSTRTSTGAATTTRKPASTSGTSSRRK